MKKITLTSILALSIACPAFADITTSNANPTCDNDTIGAYSGSTEMEAQWTANKINLNWYGANGQQIQMAQNAPAASCTYAGAITLPSTPSRPGYTFDKWVVRAVAASFNLSTLSSQINTNGTYFVGKGPGANGEQPYCEGWDESLSDNEDDQWFGQDEGTADCSDPRFAHLSAGEWTTTFSYGTVKGIARCASNSGTYAQTGTPEGTEGRYCWCQASGFDPESDGSFLAVSSPSWVFNYGNGGAGSCAGSCARNCAYYVRIYSDFRSAVFGVAGAH